LDIIIIGKPAMSFICPAIRQSLAAADRTALKATRSGVGSVDGTRFPYTIRITIPDDVRTKEPVDTDSLLSLIERLIDWTASLGWSEPISSLVVRLDLSSAKKQFCRSNGPEITRCTINSGETDLTGGRREIRIWRREDFHKVLMHELLHAFGFDRLLSATKLQASEAVVEAIALLMHCRLLGGTAGFDAILAAERRWTARLVRMLMHRRWTTADTNVREYIVLKAALMLDDNLLQRFRRWLALPTVNDCRTAWPALIGRSMEDLRTVAASMAADDDDEDCQPMNLVFHQLSLAPRLL
jgi:hypothetical protein